MAPARQLHGIAAGSTHRPDVSGVTVGIHVGRGNGVSDPLTVGRDFGLGDAVHVDHVIERDGMLRGFLRGGSQTERDKRGAEYGRSQDEACHRMLRVIMLFEYRVARMLTANVVTNRVRIQETVAARAVCYNSSAQNFEKLQFIFEKS